MQKFIDYNNNEINKLEKEKSKIKENNKIAAELSLSQSDIIDLDIGINVITKMTTTRQTLTKVNT